MKIITAPSASARRWRKSLNIPAVRVLARVGPGKLVGRFRRAGVAARFPEKSEPTLAMALGGTGLTLRELAQLYSALPRKGESIALTHRYGERIRVLAQTKVKPLVNAHRLMSPLAAFYVSEILKDAPPPADAKGGRFAYKTGTSYGYRDAWAIGYDGRHVVAVWTGRPDGTSVPGMMGRTAAAPILFDAFARISEKRVPLPSAPQAAMQVANADLPPPLKRWREPGDDAPMGPYLEHPLVISFPPDRSEIETADLDESISNLESRRWRAAFDVACRWCAHRVRPARTRSRLAAARSGLYQVHCHRRQRPDRQSGHPREISRRTL